MLNLMVWAPKDIKRNLSQRLRDAMEDRKPHERRWQNNERVVYATSGVNVLNNNVTSIQGEYGDVVTGVDQSSESVGINYAFKNFRFIHSQLSANPVTVIPRPTSNDPEDARKADAADRLIRYAMREYQMQEQIDMTSLKCVLYGTGFTKTIWDSYGGDPLDFDTETEQYLMEGQFKLTVPNVWDIFVDPDAETFNDVRYMFERITLSWEEACFKFPDKVSVLTRYRKKQSDQSDTLEENSSVLKEQKYDVVELYEYWEKGMAVNGYIGRYCICSVDGDLISELQPNPEIYAPVKKSKKDRAKLPIAVLPYQIFTDIDVPGTIYGKSVLEYVISLQDNLNRLDNVTLESVQAHGVPRLILPEGAEIADGSITNSPWDVVKITGNQGFTFAPPMQMPTVIPELMQRYKLGIDDMAGVNESMFGQQSRETSGFSMQYATNQGNLIRRRLFNKYVLLVEQIYKSFLRIVQKNWDIERTILVTGKEKALEATELKGADIDGGYDIVIEYGASLSLDPTTRREEMMTLMPLFEKAGVDSRKIMKMLKLNDLDGAYNQLEMAEDRQQEIFSEMIKTGLYIAPDDMQDDKNMLAYAYNYLMTAEFKYLKEEDKNLIRKHVKEREQRAAQGVAAQAQASQPPAGLPGLAPAPGMAPDLAAAGMTPPAPAMG